MTRHNDPKTSRLVKCSKCGYEWYTTSKLITVNCPSCHFKTKNIDVNSKEEFVTADNYEGEE